jgi:hypothetical protein
MTPRYGIDTSVLVRLVTGDPEDLYARSTDAWHNCRKPSVWWLPKTRTTDPLMSVRTPSDLTRAGSHGLDHHADQLGR